MSTEETKGRGHEAMSAIRAMLDKYGDLSYKTALEHINKMPSAVKAHFTEMKDGKNAGANRYNVAKNGWKKASGQTVKARKTTKTVTAVKTRTARVTFNGDAVTEITKMGGIKAVEAKIAHMQKLVDQVKGLLSKVA